MKLIIAGGRDYYPDSKSEEFLDSIKGVTEVVSGGCRGVDEFGELWARKRGLKTKIFPADWNTHGRAAGPIRNRQMAEYADALAVFPGGRGTQSMIGEAGKAQIETFFYSWWLKENAIEYD